MAAEDYLPDGWEDTFYGENWRNDERLLPEHLSCQHPKRAHYAKFDVCLNCFTQLRKEGAAEGPHRPGVSRSRHA